MSFAAHSDRADFADDLVARIERAQAHIWDVRRVLWQQRNEPSGKLIDQSISDPVIIGLDTAVEALGKSRRLLVIEAYDERRKTDDAEESDAR